MEFNKILPSQELGVLKIRGQVVPNNLFKCNNIANEYNDEGRRADVV